MILTDSDYTILSLLRSYTLADNKEAAEDGPVRCAVKEKYPFSAAANLTEDNIITDPEEVRKIIEPKEPKVEAVPEPQKQQPQQNNKKGGKPQKTAP